ncbi:periplasmic heavy metal sensor [Burkholderia glumae]|uniref:Periplasmic heavy metal sensor n=1 Tax=Burkholderia glumae TaxID=337 RepID=A0AAP9XWB7_BURGL|nr:periplasmic heavy metal sensor [Burkholderia glumae]ACR32243.1 Putative membrane-associated protein [Burkholderia glumae BGR1]AJY64431.1 heavy-metal resistance family protein [Burkholderia glumae LMG 2196 = ATCC 33617]KHJ59954.1 membrane protein [Burkholderia glumae]MCM2484566.1 periplasmic heavy metal sensor [Burkholderia glumae]MCM2510258.1 periplasmic heavy metal sensor [Burkholderia glumae]
MNGRTPTLLLAASVVLNVFLLGAIAGGAYQWYARQHGAGGTHAPKQALRFAADGLPAERQREFMEALKAARREARVYAREAREGRRDVLDLLAMPQLDRPALDEALSRTREADTRLRAQVESNVADFAASLTPEERQRFVQGLRHSGQWRLPATQGGHERDAHGGN